jgi:hypothetical protein
VPLGLWRKSARREGSTIKNSGSWNTRPETIVIASGFNIDEPWPRPRASRSKAQDGRESRHGDRPHSVDPCDHELVLSVRQFLELGSVLVRITQIRLRGEKLRGDKSINLPESALRLAAMTPKDLEDLSVVVQHPDVVELSFANTPRDVELLQQELARLGGRQPAVKHRHNRPLDPNKLSVSAPMRRRPPRVFQVVLIGAVCGLRPGTWFQWGKTPAHI